MPALQHARPFPATPPAGRPAAPRPPTARRTVLVGGHESRYGLALGDLAESGWAAVTAVGRDLYALTMSPAVVVPMTLGRDAELASQIAQVLRWNGRDREPGELLLAPPLGTAAHLVGWLRAAAGRVTPPEPPGPCAAEPGAVLVTAPAATAEEDAELFRVAHLVRRHSGLRWVEVALTDGDPDVEEGVSRCRLLGARHVTAVPASFERPPLPEDVTWAGPLLAPAALRELVGRRAEAARDRWERHGDDGLAAASGGHHHHHDHGH
ncbi:sirohydrochlorin chelatase [Streptosporangium carneum]|uniref:Cobalamin biosynthesis protein CbiX n=1 Tax=Streptosporangium carneum TaxID=47481 RepID=A0A9W6I2B8_9ACTN|nr:hypothetical protein [Streptosporangium carneum]GLK10116.1 hypothetical protein GCM10017600_35220 [Streptosporangium carneum]